jgi:hypothetical protein
MGPPMEEPASPFGNQAKKFCRGAVTNPEQNASGPDSGNANRKRTDAEGGHDKGKNLFLVCLSGSTMAADW